MFERNDKALNPSPTPEKGRQRNKFIIGAGIAVLLLGAGAFIVGSSLTTPEKKAKVEEVRTSAPIENDTLRDLEIKAKQDAALGKSPKPPANKPETTVNRPPAYSSPAPAPIVANAVVSQAEREREREALVAKSSKIFFDLPRLQEKEKKAPLTLNEVYNNEDANYLQVIGGAKKP